MESITISNTSLMETEVYFFFKKDSNGSTFLLDPPSMALQPGESKVCSQQLLPQLFFKIYFLCPL